MLKVSIYQDRLGPNIRENSKHEWRFLDRSSRLRWRSVCFRTRRRWRRRRYAKPALFSHLYIKMLILPRQARDKDRDNSIARPFFFRRRWLLLRRAATARVRAALTGWKCRWCCSRSHLSRRSWRGGEEKTPFLRCHFDLTVINLPRQARAQHRKSTQKGVAFSYRAADAAIWGLVDEALGAPLPEVERSLLSDDHERAMVAVRKRLLGAICTKKPNIAKTGSGQMQEKLEKMTFLQASDRQVSLAGASKFRGLSDTADERERREALISRNRAELRDAAAMTAVASFGASGGGRRAPMLQDRQGVRVSLSLPDVPMPERASRDEALAIVLHGTQTAAAGGGTAHNARRDAMREAADSSIWCENEQRSLFGCDRFFSSSSSSSSLLSVADAANDDAMLS